MLADPCHQVTEAENAVLAALDEGERVEFRRLLTRAACDSAERSIDPCEVLDEATNSDASPRGAT